MLPLFKFLSQVATILIAAFLVFNLNYQLLDQMMFLNTKLNNVIQLINDGKTHFCPPKKQVDNCKVYQDLQILMATVMYPTTKGL